jgi:hypothetical protein
MSDIHWPDKKATVFENFCMRMELYGDVGCMVLMEYELNEWWVYEEHNLLLTTHIEDEGDISWNVSFRLTELGRSILEMYKL